MMTHNLIEKVVNNYVYLYYWYNFNNEKNVFSWEFYICIISTHWYKITLKKNNKVIYMHCIFYMNNELWNSCKEDYSSYISGKKKNLFTFIHAYVTFSEVLSWYT